MTNEQIDWDQVEDAIDRAYNRGRLPKYLDGARCEAKTIECGIEVIEAYAADPNATAETIADETGYDEHAVRDIIRAAGRLVR